MNNVIRFFLIGFSMFMASQSYAENCEFLHVIITNSTNNECILTSQEINQGIMITEAPQSIVPNKTSEFTMFTGVTNGPEITLSYQCGAEIITFISKQNLCFVMAGDIAGYILPPLPVGITADFTTKPGSYSKVLPGRISWKISNVTI